MAEFDFARLAPPKGARIAVVGACGGIGRAFVEAAVTIGLDIAALDLPSSLDEFPPPRGVKLTVAFDATDEAQVEAAFARVGRTFGGRLDGLVNLAGFPNRHVPFHELSPGEWQATIDGSLKTTYLCCRAAVPLLKASAEAGGAPAIVNTASGLSARPLPGLSAYSVSKAGVANFTKTLVHELAPKIRANTLAPGVVRTAFHTGGTGRPADSPNANPRVDFENYARLVPLGRVAEPADMVGPILFLLSPASGWVNGQVLHVNGGGLMP
ncbi:MAG TPA: SDR family NAD(P)-dependent oxidoreductase [Stellaceae bacterium]|nr:SDR family NAD(P)-dependent oxidoreductase [Stellaceae bacterium]